MPVQQSVDVAVPLETAYNQFTQFEDWPEFMHRVTRVTQEDDCTVSFATKIWGKTKEFKADIETQRPDERIKWKVTEGITHTGVVSFHELAPSLTRIEINIDVDPGSLIEKAARGMRHIKRAVRADLHRYKAFIEMQELETGAWRGVIEEGELVEEHDDSYDEERDYSEVDDLYGEQGSDDDEDQSEDEDDDEEQQSKRRSSNGKTKSRSSAASAPSSSRTASSRSSSSRSRSGSSKSGSSRGSSNGKSTASGSRSSKSNGKSSASGSRGKSSAKKSSSGSSGSSKRRKATSRS
jgi:cobalamin biosynthesis protein CobT